jgi:NADH:ubiquinone oxidoreductase subunit 2 (subunit N)
MYLEDPTGDSLAEAPARVSINIGLAVAAIFTVVIGLYPGLWTSLFQAGIASLGG